MGRRFRCRLGVGLGLSSVSVYGGGELSSVPEILDDDGANSNCSPISIVPILDSDSISEEDRLTFSASGCEIGSSDSDFFDSIF